MDPSAPELNAQLGLDAAGEFGIWPLLTAQELTSDPDPLAMVMFLSQFYQLLKDTAPPAGSLRDSSDLRLALVTPVFLLSRLGLSPSRRRNTEVSPPALRLLLLLPLPLLFLFPPNVV